MASAVYQTKLTADTTQHDQALGKSAKQVYNYKKSCDEADKGVGKMLGGVKKLAGAFTVAKIAGDTFKGMLKNNTEAADNYQRTMNAVKTVTNEFQYALSTFDFSNMYNGLGNMIARANEYYNALDDLQTLQTSLVGENARLNSQMAEARRRYLAGDESAADEIRQIGQQMADNVTAEQQALKRELDAYVKTMTSVSVSVHDPDAGWFGIGGTHQSVSKTAGDFRSMDEIQRLLHDQAALANAISDAERKWKNYVNQLEADDDRIYGHWAQAAHYEADYRTLKKLQDRMGDDEGLQHFEQNYAKYYQLTESYAQTMARTDRMLDRGNHKSTTPTTTFSTKVNVEPVLPEGSIAELEKKIADLKVQYNLATSDEGEGGRNELLQKIKEAEEELRKMKLDPADILPEGSMAQLEERLKALKLQWSLATTDENRANIQEQIDEVQEDINRINGVTIEADVKPKPGSRAAIQQEIARINKMIENTGDATLIIQYKLDIENLEDELNRLADATETPTERMKRQAEELRQEYETLGDVVDTVFGATGNALKALANTDDEVTNKVLNNTGTLISQFGSLIPKILAVVGAKQAEALAGGVASAASIGWPQNIGAIASIVAELMSIFATIASFANGYAGGGIFDGNGPKFGDMHIARVNPGEMILNGSQQAQLFHLLNGNIGTIQGNNGGGEVEFRISGTTLVGVLNNQNKATRRVM